MDVSATKTVDSPLLNWLRVLKIASDVKNFLMASRFL